MLNFNMSARKQIRALLAVENEMAASALRGYLRQRGDVAELNCGPDLHSSIRSGRPDLIFLEIDEDEATLANLRQIFPELPLVAVSSASPMLAFAAAKLGARELLTLPLDEQALPARLAKLLDALPNALTGDAFISAPAPEPSTAPEPPIRDSATLQRVASYGGSARDHREGRHHQRHRPYSWRKWRRKGNRRPPRLFPVSP